MKKYTEKFVCMNLNINMNLSNGKNRMHRCRMGNNFPYRTQRETFLPFNLIL